MPVTFEQTLTYFYEKVGTIETSFSSKVVATINPDKPVLDSIIREKLNLKMPMPSKNGLERIKLTAQLYDKLIVWYIDFLSTDKAKEMIKQFNLIIGKNNITPIKKIDLILWQTRDH